MKVNVQGKIFPLCLRTRNLLSDEINKEIKLQANAAEFGYPILKDRSAREKTFWSVRAKIARKILLYENMLMIQSTINIMPLVFAYFIIRLRNKKIITMTLKTVTFLCKTISTH